MKKSTIIIVVIVAVIASFSIGFGIGYIYNESIKEKDEITEKEENKNVELSSVIDMYNSIFTVFYDIHKEDEIYHKQNKLLSNDLDNVTKNKIISSYIMESGKYNENENGDYILSIEEYKNINEKIFGKESEIQIIELRECPGISIEDDKVTITTQCGDGGLYVIIRKPVKAEKNNNEIYIYEKYVFISYPGKLDSNGNEIINLYGDYNYSELISTDSVDLTSTDSIIEKNKDKLHTNKYTFKLENGNYYFYSVEKVD